MASLLLPLLACSKRDTPEQRVQALLDNAEQAVEKKDLATLRGYLSDRYSDEHDHDRRAIENVLRVLFLQHETINLYVRVAEIQLTPSDRVQVVLYVAMTARPAANAEELIALRADLYRFELTFAGESGQWRVLRARWRRAEPAEIVF